jgi:alpha-glucosidase
MLKFELKSTNKFKLYYKGLLFLESSPQNPCFFIGKGQARFKMHHGEFKIREKLSLKTPLEDLKVLSKTKNKLDLVIYNNEKQLRVIVQSDIDYLKINFECTDPEINRFWMHIFSNIDETIYGCGEQFSVLNLRGKEVPLWVEEQGIGRGDPAITGDWYTTYYPQPTFISSKNYFCHCEASSYAKFNFTNENFHELYIWCIPESIIIGNYDNALNTVSNLSRLLGKQPKLPDWVYNGVWLGIQGGNDVVEEKIKTCIENNIKVAAVWCQDWQGIHMQGSQKRLIWNWKYDKNLYPDLPNFIRNLNIKGIRFLGYINSMLAKNTDQYKEVIEKGLCVQTKDGKPYKIITDSGEKCLLDLSNPSTIEWLKKIIKKNMINIGLSGWMADYGEYLPIDAILHSGESPNTFHNKYPVIFAKANLEAIQEMGEKEIVFFTRAGYSNISKYTTAVWAGDQLVDWSIHDGLASVIPAGISLGICGIGYYHFDIGGFHSLGNFIRTEEMLMRWTEASVFTMIMRTHESIKPFDNLQFDSNEELLKHFAKMVNLHVKLKPYLQFISEKYQALGIAPFRGCFLHYEDDPELINLKYQYLFGPDLLIAPVVKPNITKWDVYLPMDKWIHTWSGKNYRGGWTTVEATIGKPPVFYRKNSSFVNLFKCLKDI